MKKALIITTALLLIISSTAFAFASDTDMPNSNIEEIGGYPNPTVDYHVYTGGWILDDYSNGTSTIRSFMRYNDDGTTYHVYSSLLTFDPYNYFAMQALSTQFDIANVYLHSISDNILALKNANHTDLVNINNSINSFKSANHTDIANASSLTNTNLNNIKTDLQWIQWNTLDSHLLGYSSTLNNAINGNYDITSSSIYSKIYVVISQTQYRPDIILRFVTDVYPTNGSSYPSIKFYYPNGSEYTAFYAYMPSLWSSTLYVQGLSTVGTFNKLIIEYSSTNSLRVSPSGGNFANDFLYSSQEDYYKVSNTILDYQIALNSSHIDNDIHHQNDVIDIFKDLYASDDLIAAKQAQQSVEDTTISNFTGSGSGAASVSDVNATKNAQKAVKDSLNTGASASNVSNIVGVNSGFFTFFSQSVSDSINNPSISRQTRDINDPDYVPDLLSQNQRDYWRLIQGDMR